jgi:endonuclease VIII
MPEGDTLHRTANGLAPHLVGRVVTAARVRPGGPQVGRIVGATVTSVEAVGKNLLIRFDNGLEIRTHLRMTGSWHRYRPGEPWRRSPARARLVLEVPGAVAVCFDAPVVELFETRAEAIHPTIARLGPDLLGPAWTDADEDEAVRRLRDPARAATTVSAALLDQRALAGIGNIWRNETLFHERIEPWTPLAELDEGAVRRLVVRARALLGDSVGRTPGRSPMWVYGRAGRPCRRCGTLVRSAPPGTGIPRTTYWCPACQTGPKESHGGDRRPM